MFSKCPQGSTLSCATNYTTIRSNVFLLACRERSQLRKLKKQVAQETRGAMRELRKDSLFMFEEREKDSEADKAERRAQRRAGLAFLEQQEADFKSGGQGGMWKKGKKGEK